LRRKENEEDYVKQHHVGSVWLIYIILVVLFIFFTGGLCIYHTYLLLSA